MGSIFGPLVSIVMIFFFILLVLLYITSIFWALHDADARGVADQRYKWLAVIPFAGVLAYILLRPPLLLIDKEEQEIDIALKRRQLKYYGTCSQCGYPVTADYVVCPKCEHKLRDVCNNCGSSVDFSWKACPNCGHRILGHQTAQKHSYESDAFSSFSQAQQTTDK